MSTRTPHAWAIRLGLLSLALLGACGGDDESAPLPPAFFLNPYFVHFEPGDTLAGASNLLAAAETMGIEADTFSAVTAIGIGSILEGRTVLVLPDMADGYVLADVLAPDAKAVLSEWVQGGGRLVVIGAGQVALLNAVFGLELAEGDSYSGGEVLAKGLDLPNLPFALAASNAVTLLGPDGRPLFTQTVFEAPEGGEGSSVTVLHAGDGEIVHLGWDWTHPAPNTYGWNVVLREVILGVQWPTSFAAADAATR